ncbi:MAG: AtpZ/AtpI family protein [Gammaproteobacteria bacterium]|jgi:ATP synthase protein I
MADEPDNDAHAEKRFREEVARKAARRRRAARERERSIWFSLGLFGIVGWSIALPTLLGVALGIWLDRRWPGGISWTVTLLFVGVVVGCINAWYWVRQEMRGE